jgi:hypothetical protein
MKMTMIGKLFLMVAVALLCLAPCALAQTVTLTYDGFYAGSDYGYGTGPYGLLINGGPQINMICDDFYDEIGSGQSWTANANTYASIGNTLFGTQPGAATEYKEALTLAYALLFNTQGTAGSYTNNMIQFAIWYIFDPSAVTAKVNGTDLGVIQGWVAWALANPTSTLANWIIWTPTNSQGQSCTAGSCAGQEFFQYVPEGGAAALYLLLAGVSCFGAMFFRSRSQSSRPGMA